MVLIFLSLMNILFIVIGILDFHVNEHPDLKWVQGGLLLAWLACFQLNLGPLAFAVAAEVSASRLRSVTLSLARNVWNLVFITSLVVEPYLINPTEANLRGKTALAWLTTSFPLLLWAIFRLPETKDRTFEELDVLFEKRVKAWRFKSTHIDLVRDTRQIITEETKTPH
ncbi:Alpha-glucosides permease MPH3 [Cyphellophora attinorum]|uniref:Alpha-glucosides permease MPH3 n=1 Tax=Cyphellophora attinorum TaxID=1664694 RepID=A0A0N1HVI7_9EURO|nr:Alpha-glucosides permease MPH3 [Phialophora attinorum]KPI43827.1 Alpha-glucosides permease MPH3 [Phialophora attinorum]